MQATKLTPSKSEGNKYTVLVVDDEIAFVQQIRLRFEFEGFDVYEASNGLDALHICSSAHPDVIISDVRMPHLSGDELLRTLFQGNPINPSHPIFIGMSGYTDLALDEAMNIGASAFLAKPIDPGDLVATALSFLRKRDLYLALKDEAIDLKLSLAKTQDSLDQVGLQFVHELKNHVTGIVSSLESVLIPANALKTLGDPKIHGLLKHAHRRGWELNEIVKTVFALYSGNGITVTENTVRGLTLAATEFAADYLAENGVELTVNVDKPGLRVQCSSGGVRQIIFNLIKNATEAMKDSNPKRISLSVRNDAEFCYIEVADTGPGIPAELQEAIFQQYFSTKSANLGIGLSFCVKTAEAFGGYLRSEKCAEGGKMCLAIPLFCKDDLGSHS
jgi:signal transduction histidine kinase